MIVRRLLPGGPTAEPDGSGSLREKYYVNGAGLTDANVLAAVDSVTSQAIPVYGAAHTLSGLTSYIVKSISPECVGSNSQGLIYEIDIGYIAPAFESGGGDVDPGIQYEWDIREVDVETTEDVDGNPIVNAAGDPPEGTFNQTEYILILRVWRRITGQFVPATAFAVNGAVNSTDMTVLGWEVPAESMLCSRYAPAGGRQTLGEEAEYTDIEMVFEFKPGTMPWDHHMINQGFNGWSNDGSTDAKDRLYPYDSPDPIETAALLDHEGVPFLSLAVGRAQRDPVANPNIADITRPVLPATGDGWMTFELNAAGNGVIAMARRRKRYDFTSFIPGVFA